MKSEYRKSKEKRQMLGVLVILGILFISFWVFAGKVQNKCIEANNVTLCD